MATSTGETTSMKVEAGGAWCRPLSKGRETHPAAAARVAACALVAPRDPPAESRARGAEHLARARTVVVLTHSLRVPLHAGACRMSSARSLANRPNPSPPERARRSWSRQLELMDVADDAPKAPVPPNTGSGEPPPLGAALEATAPVTADATASAAAIAHAPAEHGAREPAARRRSRRTRERPPPAGVLPSGDAAAMPSASHHPPAAPRRCGPPRPRPRRRSARPASAAAATPSGYGRPPSCGTGSSAAGGASNSGGAKSKRVNGLRRGKWTPRRRRSSTRCGSLPSSKRACCPSPMERHCARSCRSFCTAIRCASRRSSSAPIVSKQVFRRRQADMDRLTPEQAARPRFPRRVICRHAPRLPPPSTPPLPPSSRSGAQIARARTELAARGTVLTEPPSASTLQTEGVGAARTTRRPRAARGGRRRLARARERGRRNVGPRRARVRGELGQQRAVVERWRHGARAAPPTPANSAAAGSARARVAAAPRSRRGCGHLTWTTTATSSNG